VQEVLEGRKKQHKYGFPIATPMDLPLHNFLKCPNCTRMPMGSASKGHTNYRVYYHCHSSCQTRFRAEEVNNAFVDELMTFIPRKGCPELFMETVADTYHNQSNVLREEQSELIAQINQCNHRVDNARELLLNNDLEAAEFRQIKEEFTEKVTRLEFQLADLKETKIEVVDIRTITRQAVDALSNLDQLYESAGIESKRYLVGMLFPQKLEYSGGGYRTTDMKKAAELIYLKNKELQAKKWGKSLILRLLPHAGWKDFQISSRFIADLKRLADLPRKMKEVEGWLKGG